MIQQNLEERQKKKLAAKKTDKVAETKTDEAFKTSTIETGESLPWNIIQSTFTVL